MATKTIKIDIQLEGKNRARLQQKVYKKDYTPIPNQAMPATMREGLEVIYKEFTGKELPLDSYTFLVKSEQGSFRRVYSPSVYRDPELNQMVIKWGDEKIPLTVKDNTIKIDYNGHKTRKLKTKFVSEGFGKFNKTCLSVTFSVEKDVYNMLFPLRPLNLEDELDVDELELLLEDDPTSIVPRLMEYSTGTSSKESSYSGSSDRLKGEHIIKVSAMPLGTYTVSGFRRYSTAYGEQHLLEISPCGETFTALSRKKVNDEWEDAEVTIKSDEYFIAKSNGKLNKALMSDPLIDEDNPATLEILEKGEYNGFPSVKVEFTPVAFTTDEELFDIDFE